MRYWHATIVVILLFFASLYVMMHPYQSKPIGEITTNGKPCIMETLASTTSAAGYTAKLRSGSCLSGWVSQLFYLVYVGKPTRSKAAPELVFRCQAEHDSHDRSAPPPTIIWRDSSTLQIIMRGQVSDVFKWSSVSGVDIEYGFNQ